MSGESGESEDTSGGMSSVAARIKKAAQGAVDATRSALPTRADEDAVRGDVSQASTRSSGTSPRTKPAGSAAPSSSGPRRVRLAVARIDPWSVMKLSFLLSVAVGIMIVVATSVIWYTLDSMAVFTSVNDTIAVIANDPAFFNLLDYVAFDRVISLATMIAVVDIVLLTALATIGAFLYNIVAALVGGVHLTMTDD
ncbi:DUF3566 domain-containing protein [Cellulomonas sp. KRMCY2]|uniref:DUF3566 domain-containing protein n=1 Tax=Cellulomonas sp. KRMCY2 TaxID=1304865 RepID=UPI001E342912|nr:DUF3566 domain-containing protein [Cellulomonas sp. KRMCY2]